jgi:hypothetical protein
MTKPELDEDRLRRAMTRLMTLEPPRLEPPQPRFRSRVGEFAVALGVLVLVSGVLTAGLLLRTHFTGSGRPNPPSTSLPGSRTPSLRATPTVQPTATAPTSAAPGSFLPPIGPPCSTTQLAMRLGQQSGAGGNGITYLIFTDRGTAPCTLRGTPSVQLLGANGKPLATPSVQYATTGMFPTLPNNGVGLIPLADQGTPPGPLPEGGIRGQASLPLQYPHDGCANSVAGVTVHLASGDLATPLTIPGPATDCQLTSVFVNPFQPAEYMP